MSHKRLNIKTKLVTTQGSCGFKTSINSWTYLLVRSPEESQCWSKGGQSKEDWTIYLEHTFWQKKNFQIILQKEIFFQVLKKIVPPFHIFDTAEYSVTYMYRFSLTEKKTMPALWFTFLSHTFLKVSIAAV